MNTSQLLAEFSSGLELTDIPEYIRDDLKIRMLDFVASAAAGHGVNRAMNAVVLKVITEQGGAEQSTLLFSKKKLPAAQAAYCNAFLCNGADMDDGHMLANGHPGVCVIPAVLALGEWRGAAYEDIAPAIVAGYEIFIRLSSAIMPSHLQRGFNGTGTSGTVAAAAAAARVLKLNAEKTHAAIGLAATSASGLMELNESGQAMKPINPAKSAYHGVMCALLAEGGAVGPIAPLDGSKGYFKAFADETDIPSVTKDLGRTFLMDTTYIKLYPACRHMHAMVDCAVLLNQKGGFVPEDIESVILYTYPASEKLTGLIRFPKSEDEAKFSLTYAAAVGLLDAGFTLADLYRAANMSERVKYLIERMEIVSCPELEDRKNMIRGARMELRLKNGTSLESAVEVPKGEKRYPVDKVDLRRKLSACADGLLTAGQQERIFASAMHFEKGTDLSSFFVQMVPEE